MIFLRLHRAEHALAAGRLEEAAGIIEATGVRDHRRGQTLLTNLTAAYLARARTHLESADAQRALIDANRAVRLAGDQPAVTAVRDAAERLLADQRRKERRDARRLAAVRQRLAAGDVTGGRAMLAGRVEESSSIGLLMHDAEADRKDAAAALVAATNALDREDLGEARKHLKVALHLNAEMRDLNAVTRRFHDLASAKLRTALRDGRLDVAAMLEAQIESSSESVELQTRVQCLTDFRAAATCAAAGDFAEAAVMMRRAARLIGDASASQTENTDEPAWITATLAHLDAAAAATAALRASPLSYLMTTRTAETHPPPSVPSIPSGHVARPLPRVGSPRRTLPASFLLQVEGGGAVCVVCASTIRIGPMSTSRPPQIALVTDSLTPAATIERIEDDYFLKSSPGVTVNDRTSADRLLQGGDKLALSTRCRLTFSLPNPASTTAVLDLTAARIGRADVRRAVLLDRELVLGPGPAAHVRVDHLAAPVVLTLRDGELFAGEKAIAFGQSVTVGGATIVVTAV